MIFNTALCEHWGRLTIPLLDVRRDIEPNSVRHYTNYHGITGKVLVNCAN
jgi:hypothetical protein